MPLPAKGLDCQVMLMLGTTGHCISKERDGERGKERESKSELVLVRGLHMKGLYFVLPNDNSHVNRPHLIRTGMWMGKTFVFEENTFAELYGINYLLL